NDAVNQLLTHPDVAAISFVGSATVAAYIYATAAANGKRVQALGGAKNHILVMDDAELEPSAQNVISSAFGNAGQRCLAGSVAVGVGRSATRWSASWPAMPPSSSLARAPIPKRRWDR